LPISDCQLPFYFQLAIGNWKSAILLVSSVWQHRNNALMVRRGHEYVDIQLALSLVRLLRQYVPRMRMATLDLSGGRQPESLGSSFVGLQLWHN
jgi:hypothetical protein